VVSRLLRRSRANAVRQSVPVPNKTNVVGSGVAENPTSFTVISVSLNTMGPRVGSALNLIEVIPESRFSLGSLATGVNVKVTVHLAPNARVMALGHVLTGRARTSLHVSDLRCRLSRKLISKSEAKFGLARLSSAVNRPGRTRDVSPDSYCASSCNLAFGVLDTAFGSVQPIRAAHSKRGLSSESRSSNSGAFF
jgi:hypothetical protein